MVVKIEQQIVMPDRSSPQPGAMLTLVVFSVDGRTAGSVVINKANPSPAEVEAAVREAARSLGTSVGKSFTV